MAKSNKKKQIVGFDVDDLESNDLLAVNMRIDGYKYADIGEATHRTERYTRALFCKSGRLYQAYILLKKERQKEYKQLYKEKDKMLVGLELDAYQVIKMAIRKKDAKTAMEFVRLREPAKLQHSSDPENPMPAGPVIITLPDNSRDERTDPKTNKPSE